MQLCKLHNHFRPRPQDSLNRLFEDRNVRDELTHSLLETTGRDTPDCTRLSPATTSPSGAMRPTRQIGLYAPLTSVKVPRVHWRVCHSSGTRGSTSVFHPAMPAR